jgi:hypothetical protein
MDGIQNGGNEAYLDGKAGGIIYDDCDASVEGVDRVKRLLGKSLHCCYNIIH